jgi:hypothetical protein
MTWKRPYLIMAPEYRSTSSGVTVLYKLCDRLRNAGYLAYIVQKKHKVKDGWNIDFLSHEEAEKLQKQWQCIAVYPEIISGNPLNCPYVARYVLYYPGVLSGDPVYNESELVFSYSDLLKPAIQNKIQGNLYLPVPDLSEFKDYGFKRTGTAYWTGKGTYDKSFLPYGCFQITRDFPKTQKELIMLLNFIEVFYCFDFGTCLMYEAPLCGCPTVLLHEDWKKHIKTEIGFAGCTNSIDTINKAKATIPLVRERFIEIEKQFEKQLEHFIKVTQGGI